MSVRASAKIWRWELELCLVIMAVYIVDLCASEFITFICTSIDRMIPDMWDHGSRSVQPHIVKQMHDAIYTFRLGVSFYACPKTKKREAHSKKPRIRYTNPAFTIIICVCTKHFREKDFVYSALWLKSSVSTTWDFLGMYA